ncbi:glycosyltransferase family 39 protein [Candidatus Poribacteria bacterium]|nr:glycosyltransferase family 39 protein [Candidatus Poribacteria bacterium]
MQYLQKAIRSIPVQIYFLALFFLFYHIILFTIMRETGLNLGAINYSRDFVPLYAEPLFTLSLWILPALAVCIGFLYICYKYILPNSINSHQLILFAIVCFIAINISVAQIDGFREIGTEEEPKRILALLEPYTRSGLEYYADVPHIDQLGLQQFLRDFSKPELFNTLTGHTRTHPPGGVIFLWIVSGIFGYNLVSASLVSIFFTVIVVIPIYKLGERLYGKKVALYSLLLFLITPNFVMFTTTSMDGPFSVFPILSLYLFYEARERETKPHLQLDIFRPYSLLTGISLAFGMFMTYATVVVGVFMCVVALLERNRFVQYLKVLAFAATGFIGFYVFLSILTDFQPFDALWAAIKKDEKGMGTGYESVGRYFHLSIANLFAFLIGVGIPITVVWIRQIVSTVQEWKQGNGSNQTGFSWILSPEKTDTYVIGFLITLLFFTFSTLFTMEVERIWIFMVPFLAIPAAKHLTTRPLSDLYWVGGMLVAQLILSEVLLYTHW